VIHRDIKPGNILFQAGDPVVTDFGIALAISAAGEGRLTETGLSLGTPYYMSPEQAAGDQTPTAASDVYSLGCVLYEMLTGEPPHTGASAQAILGKILLADVTRPTKLRRTIPANVEAAILKGLERLPADRFESASEMAAALKDKAFRHGVGVPPAAGPWKALALGASAVAVLALAVAMKLAFAPRPSQQEVRRQEIAWPAQGYPSLFARTSALAPDGSSMVYRDTIGVGAGEWQLFVKERESLEVRALSGTTGALDVVYSPDGEWIAFMQGTELIKRRIRGVGTQRLLEDAGSDMTALAWMDDGSILCDVDAETLVRIPADMSAPPDTLRVPDVGTPAWAQGLPGSQAALVLRCIGTNCNAGSYMTVLDLQADSAWTLLDETVKAWYVPTGHLVWVRRDGAVFFASFDLDRLVLSTTHESLFEGVRTTGFRADMHVAMDGTVLYTQGESGAGQSYDVVWVDRDGGIEKVSAEWASDDIETLSLSPDGRRLALSITDADRSQQVWVRNLPDGPMTRLTTGNGISRRPAWSPDGSTIAFSSNEAGQWHIRTVLSDGRNPGVYEVLLEHQEGIYEAVYIPTGERGIVFRTGTGSSGRDLGYLDLETGEVDEELLATAFNEYSVALSPDGRWMAYASNSTGTSEVFVRPFPDVVAGVTPVSRNGGREPVWSRTSQELFFRDGEGFMNAATYSADSTFTVLEWDVLFDSGPFRSSGGGGGSHQYDVSPGDGRFLMITSADGAEESLAALSVIQMQNFFTLLEERMEEGS
jgi:serine/threonine-protein kinase